MKINQLKMGVLLTYLSMGFSIFLSVTYTPIMLRLLGQNEYGLYNTISSAISMIAILNFGFNSSYIRYYAKYKTEHQEDKIDKLNGLFLLIFSVIGLIALLCGIFLTFNLGLLFDKGLTSAEYEKAKTLAFLMTLNLAFSFPMSVFSNIINAHERYFFLKSIGMIKTLITPLATLPLLFMGFRSIALATITLCFNLLADILYVFYVFVKLKCKFVFRNFEKKVFTDLFGYTFFIAINLLIDQINWNIDKLLLTRFKGTAQVAIYSVGFSFYNYYQTFSSSISNVFTPRIHKLVNETNDCPSKQRNVLTEIFIKVGRIQFLLLALIASGLFLFGKPFITKFWAGSQYGNSYFVALLLVLPASIALMQNLGIEIQRAQNKHQFRSYAYLAMAIVNLLLSIYLCKIYGAIGSAIGTAISLILANGLVMNIYYHKKCNINILLFWKNILFMSKGLIIPIIVGLLFTRIIDCSSFIQFVMGVFIYITVYGISVWIFSMNEYEKNIVLNVFKKFKKAKNN